jgi:Transposase and inactivated derivatives
LSLRLARRKQELERVKRKLIKQECLVYELTRRLQQLQKALEELQPKPLESQACAGNRARDSHNSNLPPSSDLPAAKVANAVRRNRSLRRQSGKKVGGQPGHPGRTLPQVERPDQVVIHSPDSCGNCAAPLSQSPVVNREKRQVFEIPPVKIEVTEHQAETRQCAACGEKTKARFPEAVKGPVQYGAQVRARAIYLQQYQLLPFERTSETMKDLFGCQISASTVHAVRGKCSRKLIPTEAGIKAELGQAEVIVVDETGVRVAGSSHYLHIARTGRLTHYGYDPRRGKAAMDAIGILPDFRGILVHDGWIAYDRYRQSEHSRCNAHLLRELIYLGEGWPEQQPWASQLIKLLLEIKDEVERANQAGAEGLNISEQRAFITRYEKVVEQAVKINQPPPGSESEPPLRPQLEGQPKDPTSAMLRRLQERRGEILKFMTDPRAPFDNNASERDLRMVKLQQKIGGCFRTAEGAQDFCRIRGYLSTACKQGHRLLMALQRALKGKPLIFNSAKT